VWGATTPGVCHMCRGVIQRSRVHAVKLSDSATPSPPEEGTVEGEFREV